MWYCLPGEFVAVLMMSGIGYAGVPENNPCPSLVGLVSRSHLPFTESFELNTWSIFNISSWKLKMPGTVPTKPNGLATETRFGAGNFEKMSFTYAAATGSMEAAAI